MTTRETSAFEDAFKAFRRTDSHSKGNKTETDRNGHRISQSKLHRRNQKHQTDDVLTFRPTVTDYDPRESSIKKEMEGFNQQAFELLTQSLVWKNNINNDNKTNYFFFSKKITQV